MEGAVEKEAGRHGRSLELELLILLSQREPGLRGLRLILLPAVAGLFIL